MPASTVHPAWQAHVAYHSVLAQRVALLSSLYAHLCMIRVLCEEPGGHQISLLQGLRHGSTPQKPAHSELPAAGGPAAVICSCQACPQGIVGCRWFEAWRQHTGLVLDREDGSYSVNPLSDDDRPEGAWAHRQLWWVLLSAEAAKLACIAQGLLHPGQSTDALLPPAPDPIWWATCNPLALTGCPAELHWLSLAALLSCICSHWLPC